MSPETKAKLLAVLAELTQSVEAMPDVTSPVGDKLNRSQLAARFDVSVVTVDNWIRRGCPTMGKEGRELMFDDVRVLLWKGAREAAAQIGIHDCDQKEMIEEAERMHSRLSLWMHSDEKRSS